MNGKQLRNSILQMAIEGKLVAQDAADEPAVELLKRIRAEKVRMVKEGKLKKKELEVEPVTEEEMAFEIQEGWCWCRISDISESYIGLTYQPSNICENGTVVLRSSNIKNGKIDLNDTVKVNIPISEKLTVHENDILICARNGSAKLVGKSALINKAADGMSFGAFMAICKTRFYSYVYLFLQSDLFFSQLREVSGTTTINQLTQKNFNNFVIPLPPLAEQRRIVAKIEELMPLVDEYDKAQERLDELNGGLADRLRKSVLQEAIQGRLVEQSEDDEPAEELLKRIRAEKVRMIKEGKLKKKDLEVVEVSEEEKPFEIPEGWCWCRLGEIGSWGAGATPSKGNPEYYTNGTIPWLKTGELNNGIVYDSETKITSKALEECSLRMNSVGDVLIAMYGATIGKVAIAGIPLTTNQACCACTPIYVYNWYLLYYLMASKQNFIDMGEGGAQPNISREKLINFIIPLPPLEEQRRIVERLEELFGVIG